MAIKVRSYTRKGRKVRSHMRGTVGPRLTGKGLMGKARAGTRKRKSYW